MTRSYTNPDKHKREESREDHESFGLISISRVTGSGQAFHGSSLRHRAYITLSVHRAYVTRNAGGGQSDYHGEREMLVDLRMTEAQFAQMITTPNYGVGVPCTLEHYQEGPMVKPEDPPSAETRRRFDRAASEDFAQAVRDFKAIAEDMIKMADSGRVRIGALREMAGHLEQAVQHVEKDLPFLEEQFQRNMDAAVSEAKAEIEAFTRNNLAAAGLQHLADQAPEMIEDGTPAPRARTRGVADGEEN